MNKEYTQRQISEMCVNYIDKFGFQEFYSKFKPDIHIGRRVNPEVGRNVVAIHGLGRLEEALCFGIIAHYEAWLASIEAAEKAIKIEELLRA